MRFGWRLVQTIISSLFREILVVEIEDEVEDLLFATGFAISFATGFATPFATLLLLFFSLCFG